MAHYKNLHEDNQDVDDYLHKKWQTACFFIQGIKG